MIGTKISMKKIGKLWHGNQIFSHQFIDSLDQILNPNHSHIYTHANPTPKNLQAAPEKDNKVGIFSRKLKY